VNCATTLQRTPEAQTAEDVFFLPTTRWLARKLIGQCCLKPHQHPKEAYVALRPPSLLKIFLRRRRQAITRRRKVLLLGVLFQTHDPVALSQADGPMLPQTPSTPQGGLRCTTTTLTAQVFLASGPVSTQCLPLYGFFHTTGLQDYRTLNTSCGTLNTWPSG